MTATLTLADLLTTLRAALLTYRDIERDNDSDESAHEVARATAILALIDSTEA